MIKKHINILTRLIDESVRVWLCPTDTIYGLSARVGDIGAVERVRQIKGGREGMHFITLISDIGQLSRLGVSITNRQKDFLNKVWPGPVSIIFDTHNGGTIAVRLPDYSELRELIQELGPIISTSANRHGEIPVKTVQEAKAIFTDEIDEYLDVGILKGEASTLIKILR